MTTDYRAGFRLPWTSDRAQRLPADGDATAADRTAVAAPDGAAGSSAPSTADVTWPADDLDARLGITPRDPRDVPAPEPEPVEAVEPVAAVEPVEPVETVEPVAAVEPVEPVEAVEPVTRSEPDPGPVASPAAAPVGPRKSAKLVADLTAAIRATAEAARDQALAQIDDEVADVVETIRARSKPGEAVIRRRSDADVEGIRDWCKAEIARLREEADARVAARKAALAEELAAHSAGMERRVAEVQSMAAGYRGQLANYSEVLVTEEDPARLATLAETMPEPPVLSTWLEFEDGVLEAADRVRVEAETATGTATATPVADASLDEDAPLRQYDESAVVEGLAAESPAGLDEPDTTGQAVVPDAWSAFHAADDSAAMRGVEAAIEPLAEPASAPVTGEAKHAEARWAVIAAQVATAPEDGLGDVPRWSAGDEPDGFPEPIVDDAGGGDPVDRGAIMAALEAAAEAVVAAESAAESADQAEAAAGVAETAASLLAERAGHDDLDPEAQAALSARVDAGGFDTESFADRLASLFPGHGAGVADGGVHSTQVVVTGLVSVASIASFKRHLGRLAGVQSVTVSSGSDGEFLFAVTHTGDVAFRDAIPTLPGFAARVLSADDGVVTVAARDPEGE